MRRVVSILLVLIPCVLFSCIGCEQSLWVEITLEGDHPWEAASGRRFWYTLVYQGVEGLEHYQLAIGVRSCKIMVPKGTSCVITAYPLGQGIPFGGAYHAGDDEQKAVLSLQDGPLARSLLQIARNWPDPISKVNFQVLSSEVSFVDPSGISIDWNRLAKDVVEGNLESTSVSCGPLREVEISDLVSGRWVSETASLPSFHAFSYGDASLGRLPAGVFRYLNLNEGLELRVVVPDDPEQEVFWHVVPMDLLLRLADPVYQKLLEQGDDFP